MNKKILCVNIIFVFSISAIFNHVALCQDQVNITERSKDTKIVTQEFVIDNCKKSRDNPNSTGKKIVIKNIKHDIKWQFDGKSGVGGEISVPFFGKIDINFELGGLYGNSVGNSETYQEIVDYNVPPGSSTRHIISWEQTIMEGEIKADEKIINFKYPGELKFIGVKYISIDCPNINKDTKMSCQAYMALNPESAACNKKTAVGFYWEKAVRIGGYDSDAANRHRRDSEVPQCDEEHLGTMGETVRFWRDDGRGTGNHPTFLRVLSSYGSNEKGRVGGSCQNEHQDKCGTFKAICRRQPDQ